MLIYTDNTSPRLQYIAAFAGKLLTGQPFKLTADKLAFINEKGEKINYSSSRFNENEFWIQPHALLFETGVKEQAPRCSIQDGITIFFQSGSDWPFDIFAASFYLLSRYEEYLPHQKDMYGRYAHENSLAFKENFLHLPLVNTWWNSFKNRLKDRFPSLNTPLQAFTFLPTYDIDIAWSYRQKGLIRNAGGIISSSIRGKWGDVRERAMVLLKKKQDPFESYDWLHRLHEKYKLKPWYFFLLAAKTGVYDKNISPESRSLRELVKQHFSRYPIGIHPSWQSGDDPGLLKEEINRMKAITGEDCFSSRQHYIRFSLPDTFRMLINEGIRYDFSMGYGSINGFRASVATPYYWYDLLNESETGLLLFPFCFMEANSFYEQKFSAGEALQEMREYRKTVKSAGGMLITIWHNHFLGSDPMYRGWKEVYEQFVDETAERT